jgi:archaellum biogenesis protein FlaJ (TadC family)
MEKLIFYREQIKKVSHILCATTIKYYTETKTFCNNHAREILLSVAYVPFVGWLYPMYAFEHDAQIQTHAKRGLLYAIIAVTIALAIFIILFMMPRPWRLLRFIFTVLLYLNYFVYYAIVTVHIYCIWNKKDFSIPQVENYLEKLEQYI